MDPQAGVAGPDAGEGLLELVEYRLGALQYGLGDPCQSRDIEAIAPVCGAHGQLVQQDQIALPLARADVVQAQRLATVGEAAEFMIVRGEEAAAAQYPNLRIYETEFRPMTVAFAGGTSKTAIKVIVDDASDRVLGVHMLGDDSPEIIQALAVAVTMGATKADLDQTIAVHPTTAEELVLLREVSRRVTRG